MVLSECNCAFQEEMIAVIEQKLAQGQSEEQIIQFFVAQYGEQVLTDPPKRGFNLVLWVLTPAGILVVGGIIYVALKKWVRRGRDRFNNAMAEEGDEKYQHQLENELEEFTGKGFR